MSCGILQCSVFGAMFSALQDGTVPINPHNFAININSPQQQPVDEEIQQFQEFDEIVLLNLNCNLRYDNRECDIP